MLLYITEGALSSYFYTKYKNFGIKPLDNREHLGYNLRNLIGRAIKAMPYRNSNFVSGAQRTSGRCNDDGFGQSELAIKDVKPRTERETFLRK